MSNSHDIPGRRAPPRANPLQPDRPAGALETQTRPPEAGESADRARERAEAALDNVRHGGRGRQQAPPDDPGMVPQRPASDAQ